MRTEHRVEGCAESLPAVCMDEHALYAQPRWFKIIVTRPLTDAAIERYRRRGWYGRAQIKTPGGRLVYAG
jgi:hypothetical protein